MTNYKISANTQKQGKLKIKEETQNKRQYSTPNFIILWMLRGLS
jgi:hypothetical protein